MRTKTLNVKLLGVLLCGGDGFKVYAASGVDALVLEVGKYRILIAQGTPYYDIIMPYVNLKYHPHKESITKAFNDLIEDFKS
jgi:hypothetical protein